MKNTLLNMMLVLGGISLVSSAGVGYVYKITEEPIAAAVVAGKKVALGEVLPEFEEVSPAELTLDGIPVVVHTASLAGETVGYAVETATRQGFSGEFKLMVGFELDGKVRAVKVLEHKETPGLGDKMELEGNPLFASFEGRNPSEMKLAVRKDGGDVDALTAATITSRAYVDAVARAFNVMMAVKDGRNDSSTERRPSPQAVEASREGDNAMMEVTGGTKTDAATGATSTEGAKTDAATGATSTSAAQNTDNQQADNQPGKEAENE